MLTKETKNQMQESAVTEPKASGVPKWTPEQEASIADLQSKHGLSRMEAVKKMRAGALKVKVAERAKAKLAPKATVAKAAKKEKPIVSKSDAKHYNQQAVIDGFLKHGKSIAELADAQKMSHVYAHRVLTTKVPKEYATEQKRRAEAREKAKAAKGKPA